MKHYHQEDRKEIEIYGHCYDYGKADHRQTMSIIQRQKDYKDYKITWNNPKKYWALPTAKDEGRFTEDNTGLVGKDNDDLREPNRRESRLDLYHPGTQMLAIDDGKIEYLPKLLDENAEEYCVL